MKTTKTKLVGLLLAFCLAGGIATADTVKLKDGTVVEGNILEQTDTKIVIEKVFAGGSIKSQEVIAKSDVAEVILTSPEEKARQAMELAWQAVERYKLDPLQSYEKDYYDQVIESSFRKFLQDYPTSPHVDAVTDKILKWEAERDQVASGLVKKDGQWVDAAELALLQNQERATAALRQGELFLQQGRYGEALQRFEAVLQMNALSGVTSMAERLRNECYQKWYDHMLARQKILEQEIPAMQQRMNELKAKVEAAQKQIQQSQGGGFKSGSGTGGKGTKLGSDTTRMSTAIGDLGSAQAELAALQQKLPAMEIELAEIKRLLPMVEAKAKAVGVQVAVAVTETGEVAGVTGPVSRTDSEEPELLTQIADLAGKYWIYFVGALVILIWFVTRRMNR